MGGSKYTIPESLTQAQERGGYSVVVMGSYQTQSNSRVVPYAETYRGRSGMMDTPVQHLQKVVEEESHRVGQQSE
jgi:hypothetical protein